jgi:hypothetical protein
MDWGSLTEDQLDRIIAQSEQEIAGWRVVEMAAIRKRKARQSHQADGYRSTLTGLPLERTQLRRLVAHYRRLTPHREKRTGRFLNFQPSLDETTTSIWGELAGLDSRVVEKAVGQRADRGSRVGRLVERGRETCIGSDGDLSGLAIQHRLA